MIDLAAIDLTAEERQIAERILNKGALRASKPTIKWSTVERTKEIGGQSFTGKYREPDEIGGKAAYVWRNVAFTVSPIGKHHCMPITADFDLPENDYKKRRAMALELDQLVNKIVAAVPKNQWRGSVVSTRKENDVSKQPYKIKIREFGRGPATVKRFATLGAASAEVLAHWQGPDYVNGPASFHTDYSTFELVGFELADIAEKKIHQEHYGYDNEGKPIVDYWREFHFYPPDERGRIILNAGTPFEVEINPAAGVSFKSIPKSEPANEVRSGSGPTGDAAADFPGDVASNEEIPF